MVCKRVWKYSSSCSVTCTNVDRSATHWKPVAYECDKNAHTCIYVYAYIQPNNLYTKMLCRRRFTHHNSVPHSARVENHRSETGWIYFLWSGSRCLIHRVGHSMLPKWNMHFKIHRIPHPVREEEKKEKVKPPIIIPQIESCTHFSSKYTGRFIESAYFWLLVRGSWCSEKRKDYRNTDRRW